MMSLWAISSLVYLAVIGFLLFLAWRAVKAWEKSAQAQSDIAASLRQLNISKLKEDNR